MLIGIQREWRLQILETLGERIRALILEKGFNQKTFAEYAGISESTLSRYENDKRLYQWDNLTRLADALDTNADFLLGRTTVSAPINHIVSKRNADIPAEFLEVYHKLDPDDRNLLMERALALRDKRNKNKAKGK
jgi:transcriptional regulator with XRE-family HTH domain